ncbi:MAG: glycosyltransferase [Pseudomonadota bacterium]|nr:glycosyltransferase [Pseudomonadota bacterium]
MTAGIAVVTPYYRESVEILRQCHRSVVDQKADHFMIADGFPVDEIDSWDVQHIKLPRAHSDNGNTPRGLGSLLAKSQGYDFIAWLDADNWYHPGHLQSLLALHEQTGSTICSSFRSFHDLAGQPLDVTEADEDALQHIDTSCYLIHRSSFDVVGIWLDMPRELAPICDRVFLAQILRQGRSVQSTGLRSVAFRTQYACHYRAAGLPVPDGAKDASFADAALEYLRASGQPQPGINP